MSDTERRLASRLAAYEESVPAPAGPAATSVPASQSRPRPALLLIPAALVAVIGVVSGLAGSGLLTGVRPVGSTPAGISATPPHTEIAVGGVRETITRQNLAAARNGITGGLFEPGWLPDGFALVYAEYSAEADVIRSVDLRYEGDDKYVHVWQTHASPEQLGDKDPVGTDSSVTLAQWDSHPLPPEQIGHEGVVEYSTRLGDGRTVSVDSDLDADTMRHVLDSMYLHPTSGRSTATPTPQPQPTESASPPSTHAVGPKPPPAVPGLVFVDPGEIGSITSVAASSNGWVAVGTANGQPGIWRSVDGTAWQRVGSLPAIPNTPAGSPVTVHDVVATATGFVAVGSVSTAVDYSRPFAWFSPDGRSWTSARLPGSDGCGSVQSVVQSGSSGLVAAGRSCGGSQAGSTETDAAAIWRSDDDTSWRIASVADAVGGAIDDVAPTADGFVAVGSVRNGSSNRPRVWESGDGEKWEATWTDTRARALNSVTALGKTVVAGGVLGDNTTQMLPGVWGRTSRNEWLPPTVMGGGECCGVIASVAAAGSQVFALDQAFIFDGTDRRTVLMTFHIDVDWQSFELAKSFTGSALSIGPNGKLLALGSAMGNGDVPAPAILVVPSPQTATALTRDAAIAAARHAGGGSNGVKSARLGPYQDLHLIPLTSPPAMPLSQLVWRIDFDYRYPDGSFQVVVVDAYSGQLIETTGVAN